jgi:AraC-like DNA-binding protein
VPPLVEPIAFRADDPDSVLVQLPARWGNKVMVPRSRGPIGYSLQALASRRLLVGKVSCGVGRTTRLSAAHPWLQLPLDCASRYRIGRRTFDVGPGQAMLVAPGHEYTASVGAGSMLCIQLDASNLCATLPLGRGGRARKWTVQSTPVDASTGDAPGIRAGIESLLRAPVAPDSVDGFAEFTALEDRLASWLMSSLLDRGALRCSVPAGVLLAERARKWIETNHARPITLDALADRFGVSGRWLQKCFLECWGETPMEFVASRRLATARSILISASTSTVTDAAIQSGFRHLGRFAGFYGRQYGESPSATLAQATSSRRRIESGAE